MKLEHVALQVPDALAMGRWYAEHLGLTFKVNSTEKPFGQFLLDESGTVLLELYSFEDVPTPDYSSADPRVVHLAWLSDDLAADVDRLVAAGATVHAAPATIANGDEIAMLRDPWGICLQLVKRAQPFF
ncbi:VOC family protein [Stratiformator vulcanicus]|nr:VOC family protein [Stratiformator vulcanicus]